MKINKKILILIFFIGIVIAIHNTSFAGTQKLNSLDYNATLNSDGSMDVVETWDIYISETNTLFKDFKLNSSKYSSITDVKVNDISNNHELTPINQEMYHVTKNCYYALPISGEKFEIAWGVGLDNSSATRKYQISYRVEDVIAIYNDCSELYWQFVGIDNGIPAEQVTGTIKLPQAVTDIEKLRVWAHGPLNGEIWKTSNDTVEFRIDNLSVSTMLETRVVVEEEMFYFGRTQPINALDNILKEETKWANEANQYRTENAFFQLIIFVCSIVSVIWFFTRILIYHKQYKEIRKKYVRKLEKIEYFRYIPRDNSENIPTPAQAAFLYYSKKNEFYYMRSELKHVFAGTLLDLCLKGYLSFEYENKKDIIINIVKDNSEKKLSKDEDIILDFMIEASGAKKSISISELNEYAKSNSNIFMSTLFLLESYAMKTHKELGNYKQEVAEERESYSNKMWIYVIAAMFAIPLTLILFIDKVPSIISINFSLICIEFIIAKIFLSKITKKINILTNQGENERLQWKGLQKYMKNFSLLKEKQVPDLVLWEKYLVYATTFGISDDVINQLKVVYPQFNNMNSSEFSYMYFMSDLNSGENFMKNFSDGINSAYNIAYSSSSGVGGGFSGGGGDRRWRWPEWEVDRMKIGIDIGGSHIGIGLIKEQKIIASKEKNFNREDRKNIEKTIIQTIQNLIFELLEENHLPIEEIELIGIAAPGTISNGVIVKAGNLNITNFSIIQKLQTIFKNPIQIRNDAKCAALAEKIYGAMKDYDDCVFINIGTGIGGAAFLGGKLLEPKRYSGFEFGHMVLNKGGRQCSCGKQGCFESYSSIKALKNKVTETLDIDSDISGQYLREQLLIKDDPGVKEDIEVFLEYLKTGIGNLIDIFEPEVVCLGGSFAYYEGNPILDQLIQKLQEKNSTFNNEDLPKIVTAQFKNNAGIIGAVIE